MKELITMQTIKKTIDVSEPTINKAAIEELAMELIRGNYLVKSFFYVHGWN